MTPDTITQAQARFAAAMNAASKLDADTRRLVEHLANSMWERGQTVPEVYIAAEIVAAKAMLRYVEDAPKETPHE